jgi:hypothetical protein
MRHRLLNACVAAALILGGWGGALASAVCRHARGGGQASEHECCRARTKAGARKATLSSTNSSTHSSTHSASPSSSSASARSARRDPARQAPHCHAQSAPAAARDSEAHADGEPREVAHAAAGARAGLARQAAPCGHCVWRSGTPPATPKVRDHESPRRAVEAPAALVRLASTPAVFSRDTATAPARAAPLAPTRLHVLLNCFLI